MRRILIVVIALILVGAGTVVKIRAQGNPTAPTHEQFAQKLLQTRAAKYMTAPALAAIQAMANNDRHFGHGFPVGDSPRFGGAPAKGGHIPNSPGQGNVLVNNPGEDSHQAEQTTQSETTQAVVGNNVVVGFNDSQSTLLFLTPGSNLSGYAYSNNGGQSFTDGGTIPNPAGSTINFGDPWLASDGSGNVYYSTLMDNPFEGLRVGVAKSTNGGKTFSPPTELPIVADPNLEFSDSDKDALANTGSGLFDSWDTFDVEFDQSTGNEKILSSLPIARSTNGGQTWTTVNVDRATIFDSANPSDCSFHQYIGAQPFEGSDGTIYDAALRFDVNDPTCVGAPLEEHEMIFASHDHGATWGPGVVIATATPATPFGAFVLGTGQFMRDVEFPAVASVGSTPYVAWNDGGDGSGHSHIRLASSTNGGQTWTTRFVTSGQNDEAQPALSSDGSALHLAYYEISPTPSGSSVLDLFAADSSDGVTFTTRRITNQSFPGVPNNPQFDPIIAPAYMGDYISVVSSGGRQYYAWGDNRNSVTDFLYPQGRNDPDVFFAKQ